MPNPIDELLTRSYVPPIDDPSSLPAYLETSAGEFVPVQDATKAQIRLAAKLHHEIARRHEVVAVTLEALANGDISV
jgi:hypothetical protein